MSFSIIVSDLGPSSSEGILLGMTADRRLFPKGTKIKFSVHVYMSLSRRLAIGQSCDLSSSDAATNPRIQITCISSGAETKPHVQLEHDTPPQGSITLGLYSTQIYPGVEPGDGRVIRISLTSTSPLPMPELPDEIWAQIISIALTLPTAGQDRVHRAARFGAVSKMFRRIAHHEFFLKTIGTHFCDLQADYSDPDDATFAALFLLDQHSYPVRSLDIAKTHPGPCYFENHQESWLASVVSLHAHTLTLLRIRFDFACSTESENIQLPVLQELFITGGVREEEPEDPPSMDDLQSILLRCPALQHLHLSCLTYPRPNSTYTFPALNTLTLSALPVCYEDHSDEYRRFMDMFKPCTLELHPLYPLEYLLPPTNSAGSRPYPSHLIIRLDPNQDPEPKDFVGIKKVTVSDVRSVSHLLDMVGIGLGELEILEDSGNVEAAVKRWNELGSDRPGTWRKVSIKKV